MTEKVMSDCNSDYMDTRYDHVTTLKEDAYHSSDSIDEFIVDLDFKTEQTDTVDTVCSNNGVFTSRYSCNHCSSVFNTKYEMNRHVSKEHLTVTVQKPGPWRGGPMPRDSDTIDDPIPYPKNSETFVSQERYRREAKALHCTFVSKEGTKCKYTTTTASQLKSHINYRHMEKSNECPYCSKLFTSFLLQRHIKKEKWVDNL